MDVKVTEEELGELERNRVVRIVKECQELTIQELATKYEAKHEAKLENWKSEFVKIQTFLSLACGLNVVEDKVSLPVAGASHSGESSSKSQQLYYISRPQFSPFFGFASDGDKQKGVVYRVWRHEVESAIAEKIHSQEVISEQIRRSLQGEAKTKIVGFSSDSTPSEILARLDQFYGELGAATGDEVLASAYKMKQSDAEEVSAFASRLDNVVRKARSLGTELLPDESSVDKHLRLLFWEGLKESVKDKARHRKESCKTFGDLIMAARYGEHESNSTQAPKRSARMNQMTAETPNQGPKDPSQDSQDWLKELCAAMAREVREAVQSEMNKSKGSWGSREDRMQVAKDSRGSKDWDGVYECYNCGQKGHVQIGCRNPPKDRADGEFNRGEGNEGRPLARGSQRS